MFFIRMINFLEDKMIDMKQFKDNVSSKIKAHHEQEKPEFHDKETHAVSVKTRPCRAGCSAGNALKAGVP